MKVRHRQRARAEDRIRTFKDTGMRNCPPRLRPEPDLARNRRCRRRSKAGRSRRRRQSPSPPTYSPGPRPRLNRHRASRRWEPTRLRLLTIAGRIVRTGRQQRLQLPQGWPWNYLIDTGWARLRSTYQPTHIQSIGEPTTDSIGDQPLSTSSSPRYRTTQESTNW